MAWNLEHEIEWPRRNPFRCHLSVDIERVGTDGSGDSEIALVVTTRSGRQHGVHGGSYCTLIDTVFDADRCPLATGRGSFAWRDVPFLTRDKEECA